jgi:hypothetical protein
LRGRSQLCRIRISQRQFNRTPPRCHDTYYPAPFTAHMRYIGVQIPDESPAYDKFHGIDRLDSIDDVECSGQLGLLSKVTRIPSGGMTRGHAPLAYPGRVASRVRQARSRRRDCGRSPVNPPRALAAKRRL